MRTLTPAEVDDLIAEYQSALRCGHSGLAEAIRAGLQQNGVELEDAEKGVIWRRVA